MTEKITASQTATGHDVLHTQFVESDRPHVLMITNHGIHQWQVIPGLPDTGGQNVFVNRMTESMAAMGFRITIVNRGGYVHPNTGHMRDGLDYADENRRILYIKDSTREFVRKEDMHEQIPELVDYLEGFLQGEEIPIDLIISHYWDAAKIGVELNKRQEEKKTHVWIPHSVGTLKKHNMPPSTWESLRIEERIAVEKEIIPQLDGVGATSSAIHDALENDYGYDTGLFMPPCVDMDRYHPMELSDEDEIWGFLDEHCDLSMGEIKKRKIVTEISRTDKTKRKDVLIKAFAGMHRKIPDTMLVVAIDENEHEQANYLRQLINYEDIQDCVAAVGSVWDILPKIYGVTTVYCTPSVMEGFGMSIQEAAATRVPAVSSDLVPFAVEYLLGDNVEEVEVDTGNNTVLKKGEGAIVVPADDVEGFREALEMMLGDEELCDKMGRRALDITVPHFSWHNMVSTFLHKLGVDIPKE
jgi:glycosyltransferase involved in cell wall biosynthesis